jgi:hypothetical protein
MIFSGKARKRFFFEKKKQKTFVPFSPWRAQTCHGGEAAVHAFSGDFSRAVPEDGKPWMAAFAAMTG